MDETNNLIVGTDENDTLNGGADNDTVVGNKGDDLLTGGEGDDRIIWSNGEGSDIIEGDGGNDVSQVNGALEDGDNFELRANGERSEFERLNLGNFVLNEDNVERFEVNSSGGDDILTVQDLTGTDVQQIIFNGEDGNDLLDATLGNVAIVTDGGAGDDILFGSSVLEIIDTLSGGEGNDIVVGNKGNDILTGGEGDDRIIWSNGEGSDIIEGDGGNDVSQVNGALEDGDNFELRANGERSEFERLNLGNFVLNEDNVERFEVNSSGGDDILTVQDLTGTDVQQIIFNGEDGNDLLDATLGNVAIVADGGAGDDILFGSSVLEIIDTLSGGEGNDIVVGNKGNDILTGGEGDDRIIWSNGEGSDIIEGDGGNDVSQVNGALEDGDNFELRANGERSEFERLNLGNFVLNEDNVERFEVNSSGGDDILTVQDLTGTDVQQIIFNGEDGNDLLDATLGNVAIVTDGGAGDDILFGSSVLEIIDTLSGGEGNDIVVGNKGNDILTGGEGDDRIIWSNGEGSDIIEGDGGNDVSQVNGALEDGDNFELRANGERSEFERLNLGNFVLNEDNVEWFEVNSSGGDDILTVQDLTGTDVQQIIFNGEDGNDLLDATLGNVAIVADGGAGDDILFGGNANDILTGGVGNDNLTGNTGADIFALGFTGIDTITDFNSAEGDTIALSGLELGISSLESLSFNTNDNTLNLGETELAIFENVEPGVNPIDFSVLV